MAMKKFNPTSPARRQMTVSTFEGLSKGAPERSLLAKKKKNAGRNSYGRITVRHQGGGNRQKYRIIDFKRDRVDAPATVLTLEYDPNRTANIAKVEYEDGERRYIIAPHGLKVGDTVKLGQKIGDGEGVCSPEDADRELTYGPGLRWAAVGQVMIAELGTQGGVRAGTERFTPLYESIFRDLENRTTVPENWADVAEAGVIAEKRDMPDWIGHTTEDIAAFRDNVLVELLKLHRKL